MRSRCPAALLATLALAVGALPSAAATAGGTSGQAGTGATARPADTVVGASATGPALPTVSPTPQDIDRSGRDVPVPGRVQIVTGPDTDPAALDLLVTDLEERGVRVQTGPQPGSAPLVLHLGSAERADVAGALGATVVPDEAEGYALTVNRGGGRLGSVALGGVDGAGQYYAVQTLRQLMTPRGSGWRIAAARVSDYPSMPLRGTIEGFYGEPWTQQERLEQLEFYGDVKANTYVYAPKDDPYHRELWREPYPAEDLARLTELVDQATAHHVRFTFALSPGNTVCYSSEDDVRALVAKLQEMYDVGVRAFSVPLDDIAYGQWNCDADEDVFGPASAGAAGVAQAQLLDRIQQEFIEQRDGTFPLQMVPTEYYNTTESPYKAALRTMDDDIVVMWTGSDVVPPSVTVAEAIEAAEVFGGPAFLWDNYPVNDFGNTSGRLLLAPYAEREPGLSDHLTGIVANPMNQAAASIPAVFGAADFAWNDRGYDVDRSWTEAMRYLADDDAAATEALLVFGDLNHLAPTFGSEPWQPQSPVLQDRIDAFWSTWADGDRATALAELRAYADLVSAAPGLIRGGAVDPSFVSDATPWLDATDLWADALQETLDAFEAELAGDADAVAAHLAASAESADAAEQVLVDPPDNRWGIAPVKIADGVLDVFLTEAADELG